MTDDNYWIGKRQDTRDLWLYDPALQHDDPNMIYLYHVDRGLITECGKDQVRKILSTVKNSARNVAIEKYLKWYGKYGEGFVASDRNRKQIEAQRHRENAIERHREYLLKHGKQYSGVAQSGNRKHRVTHCYSCKAELDSALYIECNACNWLICYCGACGCGYEK